MKKGFYILLSIILLSVFAKAQDVEIKDWWNDLSVFQVNKTAARTNVIPNPANDYSICLNGNWSFHYAKLPEEKIEGFYEVGFKHKDWSQIPVPGNWEMNGFGEPVYVNVANEFKSNPPYAPTEYNPVGRYIHRFEIPQSWAGRKVYINFGAVKSAFYLWINGHFVGYSEDSKTPAEFDITTYITMNEPVTIAVEAYRFCDGSYLEAQDYWRMSGITRDVIVYSKPKLNIFDYFVHAGLDTKYDKGTFAMTVDVEFNPKEMPKKFDVEAEISGVDKSGKKLNVKLIKNIRKKDIKPFKDKGLYTICFEKTIIGNVAPWSAEKPNLYTLTIRIKDKKGIEIENVSSQIGFRTVEIKDGQLKVNGQAIMVKGVNRHEHSGRTGQYVRAFFGVPHP